MKDYTVTVQVSIPVGLSFDEPASWADIRRSAIANFLDHPAIIDREFLVDLDDYIDDIVIEDPSCPVCGHQGWLLANNDVHGLRIEKCDACDVFATDADAVEYVASRWH